MPGHAKFIESYVMSLLPNLQNKLILDVGCGEGQWGYKFRTDRTEQFFLVGLDIWKPGLKELKDKKYYDFLILSDARMLPFRDNTFDFVVACEIIEHIPKEHGVLFLTEVERVYKDKLILSVPHGLWEQNNQENPYNNHISIWKKEELDELGYKTAFIVRIRDKPLVRISEIFSRSRFLGNLLHKIKRKKSLKMVVAWKGF